MCEDEGTFRWPGQCALVVGLNLVQRSDLRPGFIKWYSRFFCGLVSSSGGREITVAT
jgi:hypothetical protein